MLALVLAGALAVTACDDQRSSPGSARHPSTTTATTAAASSTTAGSAQGTIAPGGGSVSVPSGGKPIGDGAGGPSEKDVRSDGLSDGNHGVTISAIDDKAGTVEVDLVDLLVGPDAVRAYHDDTGQVLDGAPVYLRNRSDRRRTLKIDSGAGPWSLLQPPACGPDPTPVSFGNFVAASKDGFVGCAVAAPPFKVKVAGGAVTSAAQVPTP